MKSVLVVASLLHAASGFHAATLCTGRVMPMRCRRAQSSAVDDRPPPDESEEERRARLERLGREAAAQDLAGDDGGLMAEFNKRLDDEGGGAPACL